MLTFDRYTADDYDRGRRVVHIDPAAVASVEETEHRPAFGGYWQTAIITMLNGDKFTVCDGARRLAKQIAEAKAPS